MDRMPRPVATATTDADAAVAAARALYTVANRLTSLSATPTGRTVAATLAKYADQCRVAGDAIRQAAL